MDNLNYKDNIGSMEVTNCNGFIRLCFTFNSTMLSGYFHFGNNHILVKLPPVPCLPHQAIGK